MITNVMRLDIVSAEQEIFSAEVMAITVSGSNGDLGIYPGHSQLLTELKPGNLQVMLPNNTEEIFFINGGLLEVQPLVTTILSDTAIRASDIDEAAVIAAKQAAEQKLQSQAADLDFAAATAELAAAIAQITAIQRLRKRH